MRKLRKVEKIIASKQVTEGAGVKLNRVFGYYEVPLFDPFLLLDHFQSENPDDFMAGFPWHPHRGIETVTYILKGKIKHGDSLGNKGVIESGDVQWMTAGSGIIHEEMPINDNDGIEGFQLWVNLPAKDKMVAPGYQGIKKTEIPVVEMADHVKVKVICGEINGVSGPVKGISGQPSFYDIEIPADSKFEYELNPHLNVSIYIYSGIAHFEEDHKVEEYNSVLFSKGDFMRIVTKNKTVRALLIAGMPLNERVAWNGPIVMNLDEEIKTAFNEYRNGTFLT